jgi:hypothetical protein
LGKRSYAYMLVYLAETPAPITQIDVSRRRKEVMGKNVDQRILRNLT